MGYSLRGLRGYGVFAGKEGNAHARRRAAEAAPGGCGHEAALRGLGPATATTPAERRGVAKFQPPAVWRCLGDASVEGVVQRHQQGVRAEDGQGARL